MQELLAFSGLVAISYVGPSPGGEDELTYFNDPTVRAVYFGLSR